jgi:hypothetical protein
MADEDDPVIASYDVCLSDIQRPSKLYVLQYPSHRSRSKPYNTARSQTPTALRIKHEAGFVEIDVPLMTHENYNEHYGERFGKAMNDSRTMQAGGSYGLAGGFGVGSVQARLRDVPSHTDSYLPPPSLSSQTLGGKISRPTERDPIYLVGRMEGPMIHLSHLDAVVQMRPQLHHLDAEEELNQKRLQFGAASGPPKQKSGSEASGLKVESKAIEIRMKDNKEDAKDRLNDMNLKLLRDIQVDEWQNYTWCDESEKEDGPDSADPVDVGDLPRLRSSISNGDWLDKMSAPREDGKKGLLAKLRGRERERARRKKAEEEKRQRQREVSGLAAGAYLLEMSDDSELSSPDITDDDMLDVEAGRPIMDGGNVEVKQEPGPLPVSKQTQPASNSAPKKRGRPRKTQDTS